MRTSRVVLTVLSCLILAAHFSRAGYAPLIWLSAALPLLLLVRKPWSAWTLRVALLLGGVEWLRTLVRLVSERRSAGEDWTRLAVILAIVSLLTFTAAKAVHIPGVQESAPKDG